MLPLVITKKKKSDQGIIFILRLSRLKQSEDGSSAIAIPSRETKPIPKLRGRKGFLIRQCFI